jgi:hypothetical protein
MTDIETFTNLVENLIEIQTISNENWLKLRNYMNKQFLSNHSFEIM